MIGPGRSFCYADLPRSGLGNTMLVWAAAATFAHLNRLPLLVGSWGRLRLGPLLRGERVKRRYGGYFRRDEPVGRLRKLYVLRTYERVLEPAVEALPGGPARRRLYVFQKEPHWADFFGKIRDHRDFVRRAIHAAVADEHLRELSRRRPPVIGLHVRMGDFRALRPGDDFARTGHARTPFAYFEDVIRTIRAIHGSELPVTVFSDGHEHELRELLALPGTARVAPAADVVEMLLLARSKIVICSAGSSFSYWAAFLADAPALLHPDHIHAPLRPPSVNASFHEGSLRDPSGQVPDLLVKNIRAIRWP